MDTIFDYIKWRGDLSVENAAFNEIDSLILARLSYVPFDEIHLQNAGMPITVREAATRLLNIQNVERHVLCKYDMDLLSALSENDRYCDMELSGYVNRIDAYTQMQFSAVTVKVTDTLSYLSFRGTDDTLVGWKEDFNMSFMCPVPAQENAVMYLEDMAESMQGEIILGGHSKGGNLAVYSAAFCKRKVQERIVEVYNFDGPGFDESILKTDEYRSISEKVITFVPQSSIVGMLLEHEESYVIVKSMEKGILQHDIYSWEVERDRLLHLERVTNSSRFINHTLKKWVSEIDAAQREQFIDALYAVVTQTNAHTLREMGDNWLDSAKMIISATRNMDEDTRKLIVKSLTMLVRSAKDSVKDIY